MTAIRWSGRQYRFDNAEDVAALIEAAAQDVRVAHAITCFSPDAGPWVIPDPERRGEYLKGPDGRHLTESMTEACMVGYRRVTEAIDWPAVRAHERKLAEEYAARTQAPFHSFGSTGEPWEDERG